MVKIKKHEGVVYAPLSQSRHGDMACSLMYHAVHIRKLRADSDAAARGSAVHSVIAQYMDHLNITKQKTDYKKLASLAEETPIEEAREILATFCESWFMDSDKIYDTELYIALDEDFKVLDAHGSAERSDPRPPGAAYEGTLDLVVMESEYDAVVDDWKTYFQIIDADTFQSKLYPLLLFKLNPMLRTVTFILNFVRYGDATRRVMYTRDDVPMLEDVARRARARQIDLESRPESQLHASPGRHCLWCPLLTTECPMKQVNPHANMTAAERVGLALWMKAAKSENDRILKQKVSVDGPVEYKDENGTPYHAQFVKGERSQYTLGPIVALLDEYSESNKADAEALFVALTVGGVGPLMKPKKRFALAKKVGDTAIVTDITRFKIGALLEPEEKHGDDVENNKGEIA